MALPQHKTCLSVLRTILGPAGGESRFAQKIGRSVSWLKKASCGQIPLTRDASLAIVYATGASLKWLMDGDASKPCLDTDGKIFTLETYAAKRSRDSEGMDLDDCAVAQQESVGCFHSLLRSLKSASESNKGGLFSFHLEQFADSMAEKFGRADIKGDKSALLFCESLSRVVAEWDAVNPTKYTLVKSSLFTPQKKQPSRKKRPA
jgi:hypothetical protein